MRRRRSGDEPRPLALWEAFLLALLAHLTGALLLWRSGETFASWAALSAEEIVALATAEEPPLRFEFVDIPDEPEVEPQEPKALSDRARRARSQRRPGTPAEPDNPDPYSLGNTAQKVQLVPSPEAAPALPGRAPAPGKDTAPGRAQEAPGSERAPSEAAPPVPPGAGSYAGARPGTPGDLLRSVPRVSASDLIESFHNPGGVAASDVGSISFDTAVSDLGPYQTLLVRAVRRNWYERFPPAALSGLRGVVVVNFRVSRGGSVSGVTLIDSYGVREASSGRPEVTAGIRPFETSALEAIRVLELPPLPEYFKEPDLGVTLAFFYNLRPPR